MSNNNKLSDAKIAAILSFLTLCERATINMEDSLSNALKAAIIISLKFVDKEALFKEVLPDTFIDWEYVRAQYTSTGMMKKMGGGTMSCILSSSASSASQMSQVNSSSYLARLRGSSNLLGDSSIWLQLMQFIDFGELKLPDRLLQKQYPPLFSMYVAVMSHSRAASKNEANLNFSDVCKLLLLNNIEGLVTRNIIEMHTSSRLNQNTYTLCSNIVSTLADERHSSNVYQSAFQYILSSDVIKVNEHHLAQYIAHYKQTAAAQRKVWELKHIQNKVQRPSMRRKAAESAACGHGGAYSSEVASQYGDDTESVVSSSLCTSSVASAAGGMGVSAMSYDHHCSLIR